MERAEAMMPGKRSVLQGKSVEKGAKVFRAQADSWIVVRQWRLAARKGQPGKAADAR